MAVDKQSATALAREYVDRYDTDHGSPGLAGLWRRLSGSYEDRATYFAALLILDIDDMRAALVNALEGMEEMIPYCSDYFREKWDLDAYIERAKTALAVNGG